MFTLLSIEEQNAEHVCFAPDINQYYIGNAGSYGVGGPGDYISGSSYNGYDGGDGMMIFKWPYN